MPSGASILVRAQVEPFAVGDDAVEIKHDGVQMLHSPCAESKGQGMLESAFCIRSPARIGTASLFSFGGNGQSNSGL